MLKKVRSQIQKFYNKYKQNYRLLRYKNYLNHNQKLNVGSGKTESNGGWFYCDKDILDITMEQSWKRLLGKTRLKNIFAEHVWEHLTEEEARAANYNCYIFLRGKGKLRLAVPDGFHPSKDYLNHVKPNGTGIGSEDHKVLYDYITLSSRLRKVGFKVNLIEYWDENGNFHSNKWNIEDGKVNRSKEFDKRNIDGKLNYTSLIVDAVKT